MRRRRDRVGGEHGVGELKQGVGATGEASVQL
jgi:hypothetical protein